MKELLNYHACGWSISHFEVDNASTVYIMVDGEPIFTLRGDGVLVVKDRLDPRQETHFGRLVESKGRSWEFFFYGSEQMIDLKEFDRISAQEALIKLILTIRETFR